MTQSSNALGAIFAQAAKEQWSYPKTFQAFKDAGVTSYEVKIAHYDAVFHGSFGTWQAPAPEGLHDLTISTKFNKQTLIDALKRHIKKETTYVEWLNDIALAGVDHYVVIMADRTVTYYGINTDDFHVERVPQM